MGRKAAPAQSKVLRGNFRKDRDTHGPAVEIELPPCPSWLPNSAKQYWAEIGPQLVKSGLISVVDSAAFSLHCDSMGKYKEVCRQLQGLEDLYDKTPQGFLVQSALFTIRNKLWDQVLKSSSEFGLSPAARSKVRAADQQQLPFGEWGDL